MVENGKPQETAELKEEPKPKPARKALGRGLQAILGDLSVNPEDDSTEMKAGRAVVIILDAVTDLPPPMVKAVFSSVQAIQVASHFDSNEITAASERLYELERKRQERETPPLQKRGWFRRAKSQTG